MDLGSISHATKAKCSYCVFQPPFAVYSCIVSANSLTGAETGLRDQKRRGLEHQDFRERLTRLRGAGSPPQPSPDGGGGDPRTGGGLTDAAERRDPDSRLSSISHEPPLTWRGLARDYIHYRSN